MSLPEFQHRADVLDDLERDALTELFNMGIGSATALLSELLGEPVTLAVPSVELADRATLVACVENDISNRVVAIRQSFSGNFGGDALLLFPENRSHTILRGFIDDGMDEADTQELEPEALSELGNIILNGAMGSISNNLATPFKMSLPTFLKGATREIITPDVSEMEVVKSHEVCLLIHVDFAMQAMGTTGAIVILMTMESAALLQNAVQRFVANSLS